MHGFFRTLCQLDFLQVCPRLVNKGFRNTQVLMHKGVCDGKSETSVSLC